MPEPLKVSNISSCLEFSLLSLQNACICYFAGNALYSGYIRQRKREKNTLLFEQENALLEQYKPRCYEQKTQKYFKNVSLLIIVVLVIIAVIEQ